MPTAEPSPRFDAWLIDLDGTLYRTAPVRLAMALELTGAGRDVIARLRRFRAEHEPVRATTAIPDDDPFALQIGRAAAALAVEPAIVAADVADWMIARPARYMHRFRRRGLLAEIAAFRAGGGRTALVSDYPARVKLAALQTTQLFDVVIANGEPDGPCRLKPDPDGYQRAAARLGVPAARCLVIGDRAVLDGGAATAAGMAFRRVGWWVR